LRAGWLPFGVGLTFWLVTPVGSHHTFTVTARLRWFPCPSRTLRLPHTVATTRSTHAYIPAVYRVNRARTHGSTAYCPVRRVLVRTTYRYHVLVTLHLPVLHTPHTHTVRTAFFCGWFAHAWLFTHALHTVRIRLVCVCAARGHTRSTIHIRFVLTRLYAVHTPARGLRPFYALLPATVTVTHTVTAARLPTAPAFTVERVWLVTPHITVPIHTAFRITYGVYAGWFAGYALTCLYRLLLLVGLHIPVELPLPRSFGCRLPPYTQCGYHHALHRGARTVCSDALRFATRGLPTARHRCRLVGLTLPHRATPHAGSVLRTVYMVVRVAVGTLPVRSSGYTTTAPRTQRRRHRIQLGYTLPLHTVAHAPAGLTLDWFAVARLCTRVVRYIAGSGCCAPGYTARAWFLRTYRTAQVHPTGYTLLVYYTWLDRFCRRAVILPFLKRIYRFCTYNYARGSCWTVAYYTLRFATRLDYRLRLPLTHRLRTVPTLPRTAAGCLRCVRALPSAHTHRTLQVYFRTPRTHRVCTYTLHTRLFATACRLRLQFTFFTHTRFVTVVRRTRLVAGWDLPHVCYARFCRAGSYPVRALYRATLHTLVYLPVGLPGWFPGCATAI